MFKCRITIVVDEEICVLLFLIALFIVI
jgi:hypothetical protein